MTDNHVRISVSTHKHTHILYSLINYLCDFAAFWFWVIWIKAVYKIPNVLIEFLSTVTSDCAPDTPDQCKLEQPLKPKGNLYKPYNMSTVTSYILNEVISKE